MPAASDETMFLGADTIRPLLRKLVPEAEIISRPRFSTLTYAGTKKLTRLPRRSAVVAFSAADVYELAELMRRQRGGCAVVMGALSPRTRNAQVAMYQAGEVDYLVATDAIGMGLNMDVDHVAFAKLVKFDGRAPRRLTAPEIAQIAGRAGRHMNDGSFGTTTEVGPLEPELVEAIESHRFDPLVALFWRNVDLDFRSLDGLLRSLERPPPAPGLMRVREADDHAAARHAWRAIPRSPPSRRSRAALRLLWEVCQIPDFRKTLSDGHTRLLAQVFRHLTSPSGVLPATWVADQIARIDRTEGDIDTLVQRIAHIRTWTYIANRGDWLQDAKQWQERTRAVEDRLSDALHQSLTQRFVDRRHAVLTRRLKSGDELMSAVTAAGDVLVEGHPVGRMDGFRFLPDATTGAEATRSLMTVGPPRPRPARCRRACAAWSWRPTRRSASTADGCIRWEGAVVAKLARGDHPLTPRLELVPGELDDGPSRERLRRRLAAWLERSLRQRLRPLWRAREADLAGPARGLVFQLVADLGVMPRAAAAAQLAGLKPADRDALARLGVHLGRESIWLPGHGKTAVVMLKRLLWAAHNERPLDLRHSRSAPQPARRAGSPGDGLSRPRLSPDRWPGRARRCPRASVEGGPSAGAARRLRADRCAGGLDRLLGRGTRRRPVGPGIPSSRQRRPGDLCAARSRPPGRYAGRRQWPRAAAPPPASPAGEGRAGRYAVRAPRRSEIRQMTEDDGRRLDKWLWFARFCKSRTLASKLCAAGKIRIGGELVHKAHSSGAARRRPDLSPGPRISASSRVVRSAPAAVRPPRPARSTRICPPPLPRAAARTWQREPGAGRPTKAERRAIDRLRGED